MNALTLRAAERRLPGGRMLRVGLYHDSRGEALLAVLSLGYEGAGISDLADPERGDRLVLPPAALEELPRLLAELAGGGG